MPYKNPWPWRRRLKQRVLCMFGQHYGGGRVEGDPDPVTGEVMIGTWCPVCLHFYDLWIKSFD